MKAEDVVALLQSKIPDLTKSFSDSLSVTSLTNASGSEVVVDTSTAHGLVVGGLAVITGAESAITITSFTRSGIVGTIVTSTDHDLTNGLKTLTVAGATEAEFNGTFSIVNVDNRKTVRVVMLDAGPLLATGLPVLIDGESPFRGYNGPQEVTSTPSTTQFTYDLDAGVTGLEPAQGTISVEKGLRISAAGTLGRLIEAYTAQPASSNWMYVVLGDVTASKSRHIQSDGVDNLSRAQQGEGFRQQIINPLTVYVFIPTANQLTARQARDEAEELFPLICQSILFHGFDSGLNVGVQGSLAFVNHGLEAYNTAFYVHQYTFEQMSDLTFGDTIGYSEDTAFRDINLITKLDIGTETFDTYINLDDEALP